MEERGTGPASWEDKGCFGDVRLQRTRGSRDVALWGPGGGSWWEREGKTKRTEWRDGGWETVGTGDTEERWGGRGVKDKLGKGEGDGRAPRLLRVGTARAGTKGEDLSN